MPGTQHLIPPWQDRSLLAGMFSSKCPHCRQGRIFAHNVFNLAKFARMNTACPSCKQDFQIEPGFFIGAMYFTYVVNVALIIFGLLMMYFAFGIEDPAWIVVPPITAIVVLTPLNFRLSRLLMLYFFADIHFERKVAFPFDVKSLSVDFRKSVKAKTGDVE